MLLASTCRFVATFVVLCALALPAAADAYPFRHSPNGKRAHSEYIAEISKHKAHYTDLVEPAGGRFIQTSERHIQRYTTAMNREVRTLTRAGEIEPAYAIRNLVNGSDDWEITPPDADGFHFLNKVDLTIEGSDKANKLGIDLTVDIEKAGVLYSKQLDSAYEQYVSQVAQSRESFISALDRVLKIEQDAGRLDALREVKQAVEKFKALPDPPRPDQPKEEPRETQTDRPLQEQPNKRPDFFEGIHDDEAEQQTGGPKPLNKADQASWSGYYLLKYSINGRHGVRFLVKLDKAGGTLLMTARASQQNERVNHDIPIEIISHDSTQVLIKHKSDMIEGTIIHAIQLANGEPTSSRTWWTEAAYTRKDDPAQTGKALRMGDPEVDLLGLADGVYLAEMTQSVSKANKREFKKMQFEITVDAGHVMLSRHNKGMNENGWSPWHAFMFNAQTAGSEIRLTYDRDEFNWHDLFVIDMTDKSAPVLKHWHRQDWRSRGDEPSSVGALVKQ